MLKICLKVIDSHRAKKLVSNITKIVDGIFPVSQEAADKTIKGIEKNLNPWVTRM